MGARVRSLNNILLVEDEPLIAMMLEDFLELLDRTVAGTADCVEAALAIVDSGPVGAAILDVNLRGGEKSWPIADALAVRGIPFVISSGGSDDSIEERHRNRPLLQKPFTMDGVEKALAMLSS